MHIQYIWMDYMKDQFVLSLRCFEESRLLLSIDMANHTATFSAYGITEPDEL